MEDSQFSSVQCQTALTAHHSFPAWRCSTYFCSKFTVLPGHLQPVPRSAAEAPDTPCHVDKYTHTHTHTLVCAKKGLIHLGKLKLCRIYSLNKVGIDLENQQQKDIFRNSQIFGIQALNLKKNPQVKETISGI